MLRKASRISVKSSRNWESEFSKIGSSSGGREEAGESEISARLALFYSIKKRLSNLAKSGLQGQFLCLFLGIFTAYKSIRDPMR